MEYERSPTFAAQEGNTSPVCERLRDIAAKLSVADAAVVRYAADLIEGKISALPPHRPASIVTRLRNVDIARRVEELSKGEKQEAAVAAVMAEFRCGRSSVMNALKAYRGSKSK